MTNTELSNTIINFEKKESWKWALSLIAITVLAIAMRLYYVNHAVVLNPVRGDAIQYYSYAWNMVNHSIFSSSSPGSINITPDSYRDPGYPFFLALWMKQLGAGDSWYAGVLLCQALLGSLTVTFAAMLGRLWLSTRWTLFAGILMAIWPHSVVITSFLLSETLLGFLCALAMLLCALAIRNLRAYQGAIAGLVIGAASLTNAVLVPFGIVLAASLFWLKLANRNFVCALVLGALLLPAAWTVRNMTIPPSTGDSSPRDRALLNFIQGSWPEFQPAWRMSFLGSPAEKVQAQSILFSYQQEYENLKKSPLDGASSVLERFGLHPLLYARWYLLEKPDLLWDWDIRIGQGDIYVYPTRKDPFSHSSPWIALYSVCRSINQILMLLAIASIFFVWSKRSPLPKLRERYGRSAFIIVIYLTTFITIVYAIFQAEPRYSIAFRSFEILLGTTTLAGLGICWTNYQRTRKIIGKDGPIVS